MIIHTTPAAYATAQGMHVVLRTNAARSARRAARRQGGDVGADPGRPPPVPRVVWCVPVANAALGFPASPMATTTDGTSDAIVWFMNGTQLMGVDGDTGATLYAGGGGRRLHWRAPVDRADRGQRTHRRRRRQPPLLLVAALIGCRRRQPPAGAR